MRDKAWNSDLARKTYVASGDHRAAQAQGGRGPDPPEDPTVATYRRRAGSVVLS